MNKFTKFIENLKHNDNLLWRIHKIKCEHNKATTQSAENVHLSLQWMTESTRKFNLVFIIKKTVSFEEIGRNINTQISTENTEVSLKKGWYLYKRAHIQSNK